MKLRKIIYAFTQNVLNTIDRRRACKIYKSSRIVYYQLSKISANTQIKLQINLPFYVFLTLCLRLSSVNQPPTLRPSSLCV